jgi:serine/threonine-protein kinase RsbW
VQDVEHRTFASDVRELRRISAWWRQWAAWAGLSGDASDEGELCLNEAVGNIVQHSGDHAPTQPIGITLERTARGARMTVTDRGRPFNPLAHTPPDPPLTLDDAPIGGLGIQLIRAHAASIEYRRDNDENVLILTFDC